VNDASQIYPRSLAAENYSYLRDTMFSHFGTMPGWDRRKDGRMCGQTDTRPQHMNTALAQRRAVKTVHYGRNSITLIRRKSSVLCEIVRWHLSGVVEKFFLPNSVYQQWLKYIYFF